VVLPVEVGDGSPFAGAGHADNCEDMGCVHTTSITVLIFCIMMV
jgi:hypothetical protein